MSKHIQAILETEAYQALTIPDLYALAKECQEQAAQLKDKNAAEMRAQFEALAAAQGLELSDIFGNMPGKAKGKSKGKVSAKYQNPKDAAQKWSGRGRKPAWVQEYLDNGGDLESIAL